MPEDNQRQLAITIAVDSAGYVRNECPGCGLEFKVKGETTGQNDELSWWFRETMRTSGVASDEGELQELPNVSCPYCGERRPKQDFTHRDLLAYIRRIVRREFVDPMLDQMFRGFADGFRSSKHLKVNMSEPTSRNPRPLLGPEPDDQVAIRCLACEGHFKVDEAWRGPLLCPVCSTEVLAQ